MPDHLHLLLLGEEKSDLIAFMRDFKQASAFRCNALLSWQGPFWQKSYYDHVLRSTDDLPPIHRYILENPVREGLVDNPEAYPFSGSLDTDVAAG